MAAIFVSPVTSGWRGERMAYWAAARIQPRREALALHCLALSGFQVYLPRLRERRVSRGRRITVTPPLFPGYCFVVIEQQWHAARWSFGVTALIMDGVAPARVPDLVIADIRAREVRGAVELPAASGMQIGERVRVTRGPFQGHLGLYAGMKPHARVEVLLAMFASQQRVILLKGDVEAI
jgi:transcriptional antiterminator RfaH